MTNRKKSFTINFRVLWNQIDVNGHLSNAHYQSFFDEARMEMLEQAGLDVQAMLKKNVGPVIYRSELDYLKEVNYPEEIRIETWVEDSRKSRFVIRQDMFRKSDGELACSAKLLGVFMDFNIRRPWSVPQEIAEKLY